MDNKSVLFVCVENAGRSQMAEGFFRRYAPRGYMTLSAGTKLKQPKVKGYHRRYDEKFCKNS